MKTKTKVYSNASQNVLANTRVVLRQGFTMIELLVVLVIIALTSSFVGPNLWNSYEKSSQRAVVQQFMSELNDMRLDAYKQGEVIELGRKKAAQLMTVTDDLPTVPAGWGIEKSDPLRFLPNGVTNGGQYRFKSVNRRWLLDIKPLDGSYTITLL